jgi:hypothetical protein
MSRPVPLAELLRRVRAHPVRWALPAAGLALAPKCLLCLAAYAGAGALLGLQGPEICGGTPRGWTALCAPLLGIALSVGLVVRRRLRCRRNPR